MGILDDQKPSFQVDGGAETQNFRCFARHWDKQGDPDEDDHETLVRIDLETINTLCEYLSVSVGELLEYQKGENNT